MKKNVVPIVVIILLVLLMTGRYLLFGVPHEFLGPEYKGTFEGDYDWTLELAADISRRRMIPLWSQTYSGPAFVFAANLHVVGQALLYFLTHNLAISIKIYQVLFFMLAGISMFLLADYLYGNWFAALFSAMLYTFTPFFMGEMLAYLHYSTTYFCMPLAFLFMFKAMDSPQYLRYALAAALVIAYNFLSHPQNVFIAGIFYVLFSLRIVFVRTSEFKRRIRIFSLILAAILLLSAFFILPTLINGYPWTRSLSGAGTWFSPASDSPDAHSYYHSQSLLSTITMLHWPWFITPLKNGVYPPMGFMVIFAVPFLLALFGAVSGIRDKQKKGWVLIFVSLGALSVLFSLGMRLGNISPFALAYKFIPYFHMARAPYRYFYQGVLSICLLAGMVVVRLPKTKARALFLLVAVPYLYAANYYGNNYNWTFIPGEEPRYFSQTQGWLLQNNKQRFRLVECFGTPGYLGIGQRMFPNGLDLMLRRLDKDDLDKYLSLFGIKYILAPRLHSRRELTFDKFGYMPPRADDGPDEADDEEEYYSAQTTEFRFVTDRLETDPAFVMHTAGTKDVAIFENKTAFGDYRLYPARGLLVLGGVGAYDFLGLKRFSESFKEGSGLRVAPVFIAQQKNLKEIARLKGACDELILHNTDMFDLFLLLNRQNLVCLSSLKNPGWLFVGGSSGILQPVPAQDHSLGNFLFGDMSFSDSSVATDKAGIVCPVQFSVDRQGDYAVFLRAFGGEGFGTLSIFLDGREIPGIDTATFRGFRWVRLLSAKLPKGRHLLKMTTNNRAPVFLDAVAVLPQGVLEEGIERARSRFKELPVSYLIGRNNILRHDDSAEARLYIGDTAAYDVILKMRAQKGGEAGGTLVLEVDSRRIASCAYAMSAGEALELDPGRIKLAKGSHAIAVRNIPAGTSLEFISLSMDKPKSMAGRNGEVSLDYKIDRFKNYRGILRADRPFILAHSEANYPGWVMRLGRRTAHPIVTNMFLNGFIVDAPGRYDFRIFYLNIWQAAGMIISGISLLIVLYFIIRRP